MDRDVQLSRFPAQAGQLASPTALYFVNDNIIGSNSFLLKKKKTSCFSMLQLLGLWHFFSGMLDQLYKLFTIHNASNWKRSSTYYIVTSCLQNILLWVDAILICRAFVPMKQAKLSSSGLENLFVSLSNDLAFAYCISSLIQHAQRFVIGYNDTQDTRVLTFIKSCQKILISSR
jgi:hypothetical protein